MALLDDVKARLRITTDDLGIIGEVQDLIDEAKADLGLSGVMTEKVLDDDPLIKMAIATYCKANFGYDNPDAERLQKSYDMLKAHLTLAQDYATFAITFTVTSDGDPVDGAEITLNDEAIAETNSQGVAVFRTIKTGIDFDYAVTATGYHSIEGSVYVDGSKAVGVMLVET